MLLVNKDQFGFLYKGIWKDKNNGGGLQDLKAAVNGIELNKKKLGNTKNNTTKYQKRIWKDEEYLKIIQTIPKIQKILKNTTNTKIQKIKQIIHKK